MTPTKAMTPAPPKLIGSIQVNPSTVQPGQSVLVQVLDPTGKPYTQSSGVTITINGIVAPARYLQFAQPGTRTLTIRAVQGSVSDIGTATVNVAGAPLAFRLALAPAPVPTAMPIIQVIRDVGNPYSAVFSLETPAATLKVMANKISLTAPAATSAATSAVKPLFPNALPSSNLASSTPATSTLASLTLEEQVGNIVAAAPAKSITVAPTATIATTNGTNMTLVARTGPNSAAIQITPPAGISYQWDFGDGQTATTTSPNVTHNYYPSIKGSQIPYSFDVKCTIVHDSLSVTRTLVLHSAYGLCRAIGVVVPYVTGDVYATFQKIAFSGSLVVNNPDIAPITLSQMAVVPVSSDSNAGLPAPKFTNMTTLVTIQANSFFRYRRLRHYGSTWSTGSGCQRIHGLLQRDDAGE